MKEVWGEGRWKRLWGRFKEEEEMEGGGGGDGKWTRCMEEGGGRRVIGARVKIHANTPTTHFNTINPSTRRPGKQRAQYHDE